MGLFASSMAAVQQPGVFPIEQASPLLIDGVANGYVGLVAQTEWGPVGVSYIPLSGSDMIATYFPAGSPHTSTGYYATMRRKAVPWCMVRILGSTAGILPPTNVVITQGGTAGAATYTYKVVAKNAAGATQGSVLFTTALGNATLTGGNFNTLTWPSVSGATSYDVYRVSGGVAALGKIGNTATLTLNDTGTAGDTTTAPTANTTGWTQAVCDLVDATGLPVARVVALYPGTVTNGGVMTATVAAASDGIANHFNLTISMSSATTGTTSELYPNLQTIATAILPTLTNSRLAAAFTLVNTPTTRPVNGTVNFQGGSNGAAVTSTDYTNGLTQLALQDAVRVVCTDDPGDAIRSAVNAALQAHADAKTDRIAILQESPNSLWATVLTNVGSYIDDRVIYCGAFVNVLDDFGTPQLTPHATFIASAIINLEPQQSHSWWDQRVYQYYTGIASIPSTNFSTGDDTVKNQATQAGICLPLKLESGSIVALHDRTTSNVVNKRFAVTRRIKDYLAKSMKVAITPFVNGPNVLDQQRQIKNGLDDYLSREFLKNRLTALAPVDIKSQNTTQTAALGQFIVAITATTPATMEEIFLLLNVGPTVVVTAS